MVGLPTGKEGQTVLQKLCFPVRTFCPIGSNDFTVWDAITTHLLKIAKLIMNMWNDPVMGRNSIPKYVQRARCCRTLKNHYYVPQLSLVDSRFLSAK